MADCVIFTAHSIARTGVTVYSYESWRQSRDWLPRLKSGWHAMERDSLAEAMADLHARIRHDWQALGQTVPPIVDCGKVAAITGRTHTFVKDI